MSRKNLAEDVEMDILLRLPVKSLVRFRCVSKSWCSLFQNQLFITNHYLKQTCLTNNFANVSVLVQRQNKFISGSPPKQDPPYFSLLDHTLNIKQTIYLPLFNNNPYSIHGPCSYFFGPKIMMGCNGLICLWNNHQIILWNPSTREFKHLPIYQIPHPLAYFENTGFGFDSKTNDYKVICIYADDNNGGNLIQLAYLYTLSTDSWREINIPAEFPIFNTPPFNTYINGVYHWDSPIDKSIISFNMADEVFSKLPLPFNLSFDDKYWYVGLFNGYLAVINCTHPFFSETRMEPSFEIWVMKEYGVQESWTKLFTIGPVVGNYSPYGFWKDGGLFLQSFHDEQLVLYDPNTQEIEKLQLDSISLKTRVVVYVESLVAINGRREHEDDRIIRLLTPMGDV